MRGLCFCFVCSHHEILKQRDNFPNTIPQKYITATLRGICIDSPTKCEWWLIDGRGGRKENA